MKDKERKVDESKISGFFDDGTQFNGELKFSGSFRVDGYFKGRIESDSQLIIGERGKVEADVQGRLRPDQRGVPGHDRGLRTDRDPQPRPRLRNHPDAQAGHRGRRLPRGQLPDARIEIGPGRDQSDRRAMTSGSAVGVIPVRYGSTRFPGKPLAPILGRPMIQWVYEGAARAARLARVVVATDDVRILEAARGFGAEAVMTSAGCASGTDRAAEVAARCDAAIIVDIQGDEPLIEGDMLDPLVEAIEAGDADMASLMIRESDPALLADPNVVKVGRRPPRVRPLFLPRSAALRHVRLFLSAHRNLRLSPRGPARLQRPAAFAPGAGRAAGAAAGPGQRPPHPDDRDDPADLERRCPRGYNQGRKSPKASS